MFSRYFLFQRLRRQQYMTEVGIVDLRTDLRDQQVAHALATTPYYRDRYGSGATFSDLDLIDKDDVRSHWSSFSSDIVDFARCRRRSTSGSSGKVLEVIWDEAEYLARLIFMYRAFEMAGYSPTQKIAYVLPDREEIGRNLGFFRHAYLALSDSLEENCEKLLSFKPDVLSIYPSYALDIARHMSGVERDSLGLRSLCLGSELSLEKERSQIEGLFGCAIHEEYSCVEVGVIAASCSEGRMHVFEDNVFVEILDEEGSQVRAGEIGEVVVTSLHAKAMPLLRYRLGDLAKWDAKVECSCGRRLRTIELVDGRKDDAFVLKSGDRVPAWKIYELVERPVLGSAEKVFFEDFQIRQTADSFARFEFRPGRDYEDSVLQRLRVRARELFGEGFELDCYLVDRIERRGVMKRKYVSYEVGS